MLTASLEELSQAARNASKHAYAPYSNFPVGAALMTTSGKTFVGCNVENASYGLTMCAERNAIFQMAARGERQIEMIVIYTPTPTPTAPCGACRQVMNEFSPDARVVCTCDGDETIDTTVRALLPDAFGPQNLG